jgi:hypothetical protein
LRGFVARTGCFAGRAGVVGRVGGFDAGALRARLGSTVVQRVPVSRPVTPLALPIFRIFRLR